MIFIRVLNLSICDIKLRSYNGWLTNVYIHYTSLIKQFFRCTEKKITIDKLPEDVTNLITKRTWAEISVCFCTHGAVH